VTNSQLLTMNNEWEVDVNQALHVVGVHAFLRHRHTWILKVNKLRRFVVVYICTTAAVVYQNTKIDKRSDSNVPKNAFLHEIGLLDT